MEDKLEEIKQPLENTINNKKNPTEEVGSKDDLQENIATFPQKNLKNKWNVEEVSDEEKARKRHEEFLKFERPAISEENIQKANDIMLEQSKLFGALEELVQDDLITDINCNSHAVWVDHIQNGRYEIKDIEMNNEDLIALAYRIANINNEQFNTVSPILEAELPALRLQFVHESVAKSGTSLSLRKTPITARINVGSIERDDYCSSECLNFLHAMVKAKMNSVICGLTGSGKTELAKFLSGWINNWERIITIEDTLELHLITIYPEKDIVELQVNDRVDYNRAISSCMRMKPTWILLSEARGYEIKELIKSISTGAKIITTLHTDDAREIPKRILNMFEDNELSNDKIENMIYDYIDVGVHIKNQLTDGKAHRFIDQVVVFYTDDKNQPHKELIYDCDGQNINYKPIPEPVLSKMRKEGVADFKWGC